MDSMRKSVCSCSAYQRGFGEVMAVIFGIEPLPIGGHDFYPPTAEIGHHAALLFDQRAAFEKRRGPQIVHMFEAVDQSQCTEEFGEILIDEAPGHDRMRPLFSGWLSSPATRQPSAAAMSKRVPSAQPMSRINPGPAPRRYRLKTGKRWVLSNARPPASRGL